MRLLTIFTLLLFVSAGVYANKPVKVKVWQDAFVQGGESADEAMGTTTDGRLRVMNSKEDTKYARTAFLQFNLKKVESFESVDLNICVRVYRSKKDDATQFALNVYGCDNNKWSESSITFNSQPEKGELLATQTLEANEDNQWMTISLPKEKVMDLMKASKKGKLTLVLANDDFNRTSIEIVSKERTWSNGMPAKRDAYLKFK
ncbi:DNRLRE domain-containing protein [Carboxylicivirga sp. M1479]|uniref:CBM96 family carbohydrate-binding protein n=1 Tax=Carboxylicivirga sp. M1479 TaxID=2594476 RepID=UPI001178A4B9|nr:DNRLRE domain-containing protein [Carboxylicivirga sp. M1479]TRX71890.1 DNRLRE domain-containing protein [Carboxylicivirga sp. M1479]